MAVIELEQVSKIYRLGAARTTLREAVSEATRRLFGRPGAHPDRQLFWALNDVSFNVEQGETLGIIGHNGAGKSTILKLLSKVAYPTHGQIRTRGRLAALIELGAGFHPDLSGRENVYLNGSILGLKKHEVDAQFASIVEFAGLEKFIDTPIKRYSSGMYVRLAFAVAVHVKADLLLVDEVLSVGDIAFQQKSMAKMNELRQGGATIVFVSHNLTAVQTFCRRVILLDAGQILMDGKPKEVVNYCRQWEQDKARKAGPAQVGASLAASKDALTDIHSTGLDTAEVELLDLYGQPARELEPVDVLRVRCRFHVSQTISRPFYVIMVRRRSDGFLCFNRSFVPDESPVEIQGDGMFEARLGQILLVPGEYTLEAGIGDTDFIDKLVVSCLSETFSVKGILFPASGIYEPNVEWQSLRM